MAKATDGLAFGVTRHCRIEGLPPMPPTPAIWRRRSKVKRCMFQYKQSRSRLGTFEPAKSMESGEVLALGNPCETAKPHSRIPAQGVAVWSAAPISFRRLRTAKSMEVSALGNPCKTAEPLQHSGPMGGRLVCRADLVWAPLNPLKTWRVERYWRWATHAKQQSLCRIQAQWVAVWSAEPISFRRLRTR